MILSLLSFSGSKAGRLWRLAASLPVIAHTQQGRAGLYNTGKLEAAVQNGQRIYIDEIPINQKTTDPIAPECDFLCAIAEQDIL